MSSSASLSIFERTRRILVSVVLFVYLTILVIAASPASPFKTWCDRTFKPAVNYLGLYNSYGVFAPDPAYYDQVFRAVIEFQDGTKKTWIFPYLTQWRNDEWKRHVKLAWEEWQYYFMWSPDNLVLVRDAAKYLAWLHRNPSNQPVRVHIYRDYSEIVVPDVKLKSGPDKPTLTEEVADYPVSSQDLK